MDNCKSEEEIDVSSPTWLSQVTTSERHDRHTRRPDWQDEDAPRADNGAEKRGRDKDRNEELANVKVLTGSAAIGYAALGLAGVVALAAAGYQAGRAIAAEVARNRVDEVVHSYTRAGELFIDPLSLVAMDARCSQLKVMTRPLKVDIEHFRAKSRYYGVEDVVVRYVNELAGDPAFVDKAIAEHWWCELELEQDLGYIVCVKHRFEDGATMRLLYAPDRPTACRLGLADVVSVEQRAVKDIGELHSVIVPNGLVGPSVVELIGLLETIDPGYHVLRSNCQHLCRTVYDWFLDHLAVTLMDKEDGKPMPTTLNQTELFILYAQLQIGTAARRARESKGSGHVRATDCPTPEESFLRDVIRSLSMESRSTGFFS